MLRRSGAVAAATIAVSVASLGGASAELQTECANYLKVKNLADVNALKTALGGSGCAFNSTAHELYHPDPKPRVAGATDTTGLECKFGNTNMQGHCGTCCGLRPHFNWIVGTCEETQGTGQFCRGLPDCLTEGSPKINYVAAYQFDGTDFVLMDESSVGELSDTGIAGNYQQKTGWEAHKDDKRWKGGDWTTKYAPWASNGKKGPEGPRGVTPPAGLFVMSADNFYYGAFYMLSQVGINLEGMGQPTGTNCWNWELDPVEGTAGWSPGNPTPGNVNMLYSTDDAQASGCMPLSYMSNQANAFRKTFGYPESFREYCQANPQGVGCQPWQESISWSGGAGGSQRYENLWDESYIFAVVIDSQGYWNYRWMPSSMGGKSGWSGIEQYSAARKVPARPAAVKDPRGLKTDVPGDVAEAVMLQPSSSPEGSCVRSSVESVNWQFGSNALGSMGVELDQGKPGGALEGAQNWWSHFADTQQNQGYPLSIAGVPKNMMVETLACNTPQSFSCQCAAKRAADVLSRNATHPVAQDVQTIVV